jgi:cell cycle arrest protein BUB3
MSSTPRAVRQAPLRDAPADGISRVRFTSAELLVASSWDGHVYLYDTTANALRARYAHRAAVLDVASLSAGVVVSGGIDRELRSYDWTTGTSELIGTHDGAIRCVETLSDTAVVSGGWDKKLRLWDVRAPNGCQAVHEQPDKVFAMAVSEHRGLPMIIVATAGRHVHILDPRYLDEPVQRRESQLKSQTRCIAASPNGENYAMGSVDGRVAMEYVDMSAEAQALKYAFKCHRSTGTRSARSRRRARAR